MTLRFACVGAAALVGLAVATWAIVPVEAHKPITSKYTYNDDVYPVFRDRCGRCHVTGGVGPMSLLTYKDAYPWAESIRIELLADTMPPWHADEGLGQGRTLVGLLTPRELDVMLVWVTGGTPAGNPASTPAPVTPTHDWPLGAPDLVLPFPNPFTLAPEKPEDTYEVKIPTGLTRARMVRAVDLRPGNPAIVRHAEIGFVTRARRTPAPGMRTVGGDGAASLLAQWSPGADPVVAERGRDIRLPAGAALTVRVRYKRTWMYEGRAMTDRSRVGLYFGDRRPAGRTGSPDDEMR